jgi:hypothetical protein
VQCATLGVGEVVTVVVCNEVDNGTVGESGRLAENEPLSRRGLGEGSCHDSKTSPWISGPG